MKFPHGKSVVAVLAAVFLWSCTFTIPTNPSIPMMGWPEVKLPVKVGLFIDSQTKTKEANDILWRIFIYPVGEALEKIALPALSSVFAEVQKVDRTHPPASGN